MLACGAASLGASLDLRVPTLIHVPAAEIIQLVIAVATAIAAWAAWRAASITRTSATESAIGQFLGVHTQRLATLAQLHTKLSLITEAGTSEGAAKAQGIELREMAESTGVRLDDTLKVAKAMIEQNKGVATGKADTEIVARIQREKEAIISLQRALLNPGERPAIARTFKEELGDEQAALASTGPPFPADQIQ